MAKRKVTKASAEQPNERDMRRLREAQGQFGQQLLQIPGVHGVGIGYKRTAGEKTKKLALVVRVEKKLPLSVLDSTEVIPKRIRFFSRTENKDLTAVTDVQEQPRPVPYTHLADHSLEARIRPVPGGYSIGAAEGGTLGGWVWDNVTDQVVLLSNQHVLGSLAGVDVLQPSSGDGGLAPADHFADVLRSGTLDAAIAAPIDGDDVELEIAGISPAVYETATATIDMLVEKSGQTTEHTLGEVELVNYMSNHYGSTNDIEVHPDPAGSQFAYYGDSGSLIVERTHPDGRDWKRIVGLLWGGVPSEGNAYAHHIADVFNDLNLTTVCAGVLQAILDSIFGATFAEFAERGVPQRLIPFPVSPRFPDRRFHHGISRDFEKRLAVSPLGTEIVAEVHANRVAIVNLLRAGDGRRALAAAMGPFVRGSVTTDDILNKTVTDEDVERFSRLLEVTQRLQPDMKPTLRKAAAVMKEAQGRTVREALMTSANKRKPKRPKTKRKG